LDIPTSTPQNEPLAQTLVEQGSVPQQPVKDEHVAQSGSFQPEQQPATEAVVNKSPADENVAKQPQNPVVASEPILPAVEEHTTAEKREGGAQRSNLDLRAIEGHVDTYKAAQEAIETQGIVAFEQAIINARIEGAVQNV
jgi:hypothetical protein